MAHYIEGAFGPFGADFPGLLECGVAACCYCNEHDAEAVCLDTVHVYADEKSGVSAKNLLSICGLVPVVAHDIVDWNECPMNISAGFDMAGVTGTVSFGHARPGADTVVHVKLQGLGMQASLYHIHTDPVPEPLAPSHSVCDDSSVGGRWNPRGVPGPCNASDYGSCEVGDLSGKHGTLAGLDTVDVIFSEPASTLPLTGVDAIVGRSIVIYTRDTGRRLACASIDDEYTRRSAADSVDSCVIANFDGSREDFIEFCGYVEGQCHHSVEHYMAGVASAGADFPWLESCATAVCCFCSGERGSEPVCADVRHDFSELGLGVQTMNTLCALGLQLAPQFSWDECPEEPTTCPVDDFEYCSHVDGYCHHSVGMSLFMRCGVCAAIWDAPVCVQQVQGPVRASLWQLPTTASCAACSSCLSCLQIPMWPEL